MRRVASPSAVAAATAGTVPAGVLINDVEEEGDDDAVDGVVDVNDNNGDNRPAAAGLVA